MKLNAKRILYDANKKKYHTMDDIRYDNYCNFSMPCVNT